MDWNYILELAIKWAVPFLLAGLVSWIVAKAARPKEDLSVGAHQRLLKQWEELAKESNVHEQLCGQNFEKIRKESETMDKQILDKLEQLNTSLDDVKTTMDKNRKASKHEIDVVRQGVLDAHLQNLIASCRQFIKKGYITPAELIQYNERLAIYHRLGGNGHMDPWDERIKALPVREAE